MKKHIKYPKIGQFRNVLKSLINQVTFVGYNEAGLPMHCDVGFNLPSIVFKGTTKLHGTNASVCYNATDGFWVQSRNRIITVENDNAGFAFFAEKNKSTFRDMINEICSDNDIDPREYTVSIYGEWAGKGIQKGVGISELERAFYIFGVKISDTITEDNANAYWVDSECLSAANNKIYNVEDFGVRYLTIDLGRPELAQNELIRITEKIEKECPVAKALGVEGVGEGVVWSTTYQGVVHRFKVKGSKHSVSKVKKLASVNVENIESIKAFIEYAITEARLSQAIEYVFKGEDLDIRKLGDVIRWFISDILAEELDVMVENNLEPKALNKHISNEVRRMFFKALGNA